MADEKKKKKKRAFTDSSEPSTKKSKKGGDYVELQTVNFPAKYRPRRIEDYVGQDHIAKIFKGWQKSGIVPSTILISGHTGAGKTTFARMLAKYINCDTFSACGKCRSCQMADSGPDAHPDIMQRDMGDVHGKVDGTQAIIDSSLLSPMFKRRVYLLDEVHLMSSAAESKLLVTTEEPPAHVVWILITTNPEKLKSPLVGRCTRLNIMPIEADVIAKRLTQIAEAESILPSVKKEKARNASEKAIKQIANLAGGQMRGAIGTLQNVYSAVLGGETFDSSLIMTIAAADPEVQLEEKAVQMIGAFLSMDLLSVIQFLREAGDPRGIMQKARWTIHSIIGHLTQTNKWQSAGLKMFLNLARLNKDVDVNLPKLINLQSVLNDCEVAFNSSSVPPDIMLETSICKLMADIYAGKIDISVSPIESDTPKKKKKK